MIQEHLSLKRLQSKIYSEIRNLEFESVSGQKGFATGNYYGISVLERSTISGVSGIK
jgi:hypothetical protein